MWLIWQELLHANQLKSFYWTNVYHLNTGLPHGAEFCHVKPSYLNDCMIPSVHSQLKKPFPLFMVFMMCLKLLFKTFHPASIIRLTSRRRDYYFFSRQIWFHNWWFLFLLTKQCDLVYHRYFSRFSLGLFFFGCSNICSNRKTVIWHQAADS